jgi:hypothetical protein
MIKTLTPEKTLKNAVGDGGNWSRILWYSKFLFSTLARTTRDLGDITPLPEFGF